MICPQGHVAELEIRLIEGEPSVLEVSCICQECGRTYSTSLYGSTIYVKDLPQQPALGPQDIGPEDDIKEE
jgi:hypothetical protein